VHHGRPPRGVRTGAASPTASIPTWCTPGTTIRIVARFDDHADPTAPYMFHCHVLRHEDRGMMGQFVVVERGDEPDLAAMPGHDH
jgi:FtsP/CotA-like multicopper oxidase with cupredoxin domain